jgi:hypothetical protein
MTVTETRRILIACAVATVASVPFVAIVHPVSAMVAPQLRPIISESSVVLASNVVRRPVYDSAGQSVNRLPGRSIGLGTPRKMQCLNYNGRNRCRPV